MGVLILLDLLSDFGRFLSASYTRLHALACFVYIRRKQCALNGEDCGVSFARLDFYRLSFKWCHLIILASVDVPFVNSKILETAIDGYVNLV